MTTERAGSSVDDGVEASSHSAQVITSPGVTQAMIAPLGAARTIPRIDVVDYVGLWLVLLFGVTANQVFGPLGAIGTPALMTASLAPILWLAVRDAPSPVDDGPQPFRAAMLIYLWYMLATVVGAHARSLTPLEQSAALREAFTLISLCGMSLLVMDGVSTIERLQTMLRRLLYSASFLAATGLLESFAGQRLLIRVPGLRANQLAGAVGTRSVFNRPYGTALHPIEFGVVLAALFPIALFFALHSERGSRRRPWLIGAAVAIGLAVPLSISRSGIVALAGALVIVFLGWNWRMRLQGIIVGVLVIPVLWLTIPGLVGTFQGMFTSFDTDPSVVHRLDRLPRIMDLIREYPLFGRGAGTFSVDDYFLVDNEFWVSTIETGILGICFTYGLMIFACIVAITSQHHQSSDAKSAQLGYAIAAGIVAIGVSLWTFDAFFFHILRGVLFLLMGSAGALWRLTRRETNE